MRKLFIVSFIFIILIFQGCSNKDITVYNLKYIGENDTWAVDFKISGTGEFYNKNGTLHYRSNTTDVLTVNLKEDLSILSNIRNIEITYETSVSSGKLTEDFVDGSPYEKTYVLKSSSSGAIPNKDEIIRVTISLDGRKEVIELKNVGK